jgi:5,10-methylenetetrahydromethanopterin reductase
MTRSSLGVMFRRHLPPERLVPIAQLVEQVGLDELWIVEDCFWAGGMTATAAALAATDQLRVGLGIAPAVVRNPAIAAMELGGLARMFPGRLVAGFGHGVASWMEQIGALPGSQLAALEETVDAVRRLLHGERLTVTGRHVMLDDVALVFPPDDVPALLCGVTGPKSLDLTARVADGVLLPEGSSPTYVRAAIDRITTTRDGQLPAPACAVYVLFAVADDPAEAAAAVLPAIGTFAGQAFDANLARLGVVEPVNATALVDRYAVAGTPAQCAAAIRNFVAAGATSVILVPQPEDQEAQITRAAREVLPLV